jgi:septal ring factor EnvC (AmiA/AmiB activator)
MIKSQQKTKVDKIEHIKKLTKVSSATLAANNHYVLDENICDLVYAKHQAEEAAQAAASERRRAAEEKKTENLNKALEKFKICPNGLTVPEMKALVVAATNTTDSPVKSRKADLQAQLYHEPRYGRVQAMANNLTLTSTTSSTNESVADAAAEGLLALFGNPADTTPV